MKNRSLPLSWRSALLSIPVLVTIVTTVLLWNDLRRQLQTAALVEHTYQVLNTGELLLSTLKDAETGQRGYLLTGQERYLEPYQSALGKMASAQADLRRSTADNPAQQERLKETDRLIAAKLDELRRTIQLRRDGNLAAALAQVSTGRGKATMDQLRSVMQQAEETERGLLSRRQAEAVRQAHRTRLVVLVGSLSLLLMLVYALVTIERDGAHRQQNEKELRETERLLNAVLDSLPVAVAIADPTGRLVRFNPACDRVWGSAPRSESVESYGEYIGYHPSDGRRVEAYEWPLSRALRQGEAVTNELYEIERFGDSKRLIVEISAAPVHDETGKIVGGVVATADVTEQVRAEQALRESEARFRQMADNISQFAWMADETGSIFWYNQRWYDYTGTTFDEMRGWGWQKVHHPEYVERVTERFRSFVEAGEVWEDTFPLRGRNGQYRWFLSRALPICDESGAVVRWFGTNTDITEFRQADEALRRLAAHNSEQAAELDTLYRTIPVGLTLVDSELRYQRVNEAITSINGVPVEAHLGRTIREVLPQLADLLESLHRKVFDTGEPVLNFEIRAAVPQGTAPEREWLTSYHPLKNENGVVTRVNATVVEVTALRQAEAALRELNTDLERRVEERTAQLGAANRELEAFAYSVSHDLRAPLRAVDGYSKALIEDYSGKPLDEEGQRLAGKIRASALRMGQLIEDLLQLSRVSRGQMQLGVVDLSALGALVIDELRRADPARQVQTHIESGLCARGDARLLRIALENLLGNAWKFTSKKTDACIELTSLPHNGKTAYRVKDNGAGFSMVYAEQLFTPFQRLHKATDFPGTGIGLATVQRIIHRHGGQIWAEAEKDKGAAFYFTLN